MAMKVMNKKEVVDRNYIKHTILEKDIMAIVCKFQLFLPRTSTKTTLWDNNRLENIHLLWICISLFKPKQMFT